MRTQYFTSIGTALVLAMSSSAAIAQSIQPQKPQTQPQQTTPKTNVSPQELKKFASAVKKLQPIQQQAQTQVTQAIQQQNLSEKRFDEIYKARQERQTQPTTAITSEETKKFEQVMASVKEIEQATQSKMEQTVREEGLDIQRFNQIFVAIKQNPPLLQQVQQMLRS